MNRSIVVLVIGVLLVVTLFAVFLSLLAVHHQIEGIMLIGKSFHTFAQAQCNGAVRSTDEDGITLYKIAESSSKENDDG